MERNLIMLGTGNAMVTKCYNTCFAVQNGEEYLLVDAGGGNGILGRLEEAGIPVDNIHHMFVTHAHTDHVLGVVATKVILRYTVMKSWQTPSCSFASLPWSGSSPLFWETGS